MSDVQNKEVHSGADQTGTVEFWGFDYRLNREVCYLKGVTRPTFIFDLSGGSLARLSYGQYEDVLLKFKQMVAAVKFTIEHPKEYMELLVGAGFVDYADEVVAQASLRNFYSGWVLVEVVPAQELVSGIFQGGIRASQLLGRTFGHLGCTPPERFGVKIYEPVTVISADELNLHVDWDRN